MTKAQSLPKTRIRSRLAHPLAAMGVIYAACAIFLPPAVHADSLQYSIIFTTTSGIAPTGGSFYYDAAATVGFQFSSFYVTWDGFRFDLTGAANSPIFVSDNGICVDNVFQFLSTGTACSTHAYYAPDWEAGAGEYDFEDTSSDRNGVLIMRAIGGDVNDDGGYGGWAIVLDQVPAPEPSSLMLALAGGGWLLYLRRSSPATKRNRPAGPNPHPLP
jgi:hypothetical protein